MALAVRIVALLCFSSALSYAGVWSGTLVDANCYAAEQRNVNPTDTLTSVDRDTNRQITYCSPRAKTKSFTIVQSDGLSFTLDSAGNAKAVELVRKAGKQSRFAVVVTGEENKNIIKVDSISVAR
jgi:hypothetical protein